MQTNWLKNFVSVKSVSDQRGTLQEFSMRNIDFSVKRVYSVTMLLGESRGFHAHKTLHQVLTVLTGEVNLDLDDGVLRERIRLQSGENVRIKQGVWRVITPVKSETTFLVFASEDFDQNDYIRDYEEFVKWSNEIL